MSALFARASEYLASAHMPVLILDPQGIPLEWNSAAEKVFPHLLDRPSEPLAQFVTSDNSSIDEIRFSRLLSEEGSFFEYDFNSREKDETEQWYKLLATRQKSGEFLVIIDDISRQKQKETHLVQAKKNAEKASVTRSQFLANISHEIRTPIQTIIGMMELLADTRLDEEQTEYSRQVRFSADVMLTLVNDLLDITKAEAGQMKIEHIDFCLADVIERSVDLVSMEAHKKGLEICIDIDPKLPDWVVGDPNRLQQVILNLVKNAIKFTANGQVIVRVEYKSLDEENLLPGSSNEVIYIQVIDTGIGINAKSRQGLFNQFYQADSSTTRKYGGTGLGLAISKTIIDLIDGKIGVLENTPQGSNFWFQFPLTHSLKEEPTKELPQNTDIRFLVVDDNIQTRSILSQMLITIGFSDITLVSSGRNALEQLNAARQENRPFDIVFIDMIMPEMDGWRLAAEINQNREINQVRLYLMVPEGSFGAEAKMKLLEWFNGYLYKPIKKRMLEDLLRAHLLQTIDLEVVEELEPLEDLPSKENEQSTTLDIFRNGGNKTLLSRAKNIIHNTPSPIPAEVPPKEILPAEGLTILVAEDHPVNRKLLSIFLEKAGAKVIPAEDGLEATKVIEQEHIDIVFMDIQMPKMNGYEASKWIRDKGHNMPIIACTASAQPNEKQLCLACGMTDMLPKPYRRQDVLDLLDGLINTTEDTHVNTEPKETFNRDLFFDIVGGDMETGIILIHEYLSQTESHLAIIEEDLANLDRAAMEGAAHLIKGSSLNITATELAAASLLLEQGAKTLSPEELSTIVAKIKEAFKVLEKLLQEEFPK